jgi:hypothetical protein
MNKFSGYREFTLANGRKLELKFSNGATEILAELLGLDSLEEIDSALTMDLVEGKDEDGKITLVPTVTARYLKNLRLYVYSAAKYAAMVQGKPIDFNEWDAAEWIEEIGTAALMKGVDVPDEAAKKNEQLTTTETQTTPQPA